MSEAENPPAFPAQRYEESAFGDNGAFIDYPGMSLRDWFAGQALSGMLASEAGIQPYPYDWAAERAYLLADAMLSARHPTQEQG
jgi:hypothetical protein